MTQCVLPNLCPANIANARSSDKRTSGHTTVLTGDNVEKSSWINALGLSVRTLGANTTVLLSTGNALLKSDILRK